MFKGVFDTELTNVVSIQDFMLCIGFAIILGLIIAFAHCYKSKSTRSFLTTLTLLPAIVCVVIMMVNGNIGAGVAVAGTFSLVRFRSVPGTAREILMIFLAMASGLMCGMGYIGFATVFTVIMCILTIMYDITGLKYNKDNKLYKTMHVIIPENLDYSNIFDDIFKEYTDECELTRVKTTNMGSLFKLTYDLKLKSYEKEKEMIDKIRCRNGNLEITISNQSTTVENL